LERLFFKNFTVKVNHGSSSEGPNIFLSSNPSGDFASSVIANDSKKQEKLFKEQERLFNERIRNPFSNHPSAESPSNSIHLNNLSEDKLNTDLLKENLLKELASYIPLLCKTPFLPETISLNKVVKMFLRSDKKILLLLGVLGVVKHSFFVIWQNSS